MFDIKDIAPADNSIGDWWKYVTNCCTDLGLEFLFIGLLKRQEKKITSRNL
jgi:hypothetical protein